MTLAPSQPLHTRSAVDQAVVLLRQELARRWHVGDRLPPIKQLAKSLGVGQTNLHRAAQQLAQEGLLVASTRRGTFVAQLPQAEGSLAQAIHSIGLVRRSVALLQVIGQTVDPFLQPAMETLAAELRQYNVSVQPVGVDIRGKLPDDVDLETFDAVITLQASLVRDPRRPTVVLTTAEVEPSVVHGGYDMVSADSEQGAMLAGQWMKRVAPRGVGFIGTAATRGMDSYEPISQRRLRGFERGLGRAVPRECQLFAGAFRAVSGAEVFEHYLKMPRRPRGFFCASDDLAVGFLHAAHVHGLRAGEDLQVIGFDGQVRGQVMPEGPLTTVRVPTQAMGRAAAELLLSRLAQPDRPVRRVLLACDFIEGRTARLPASSAE